MITPFTVKEPYKSLIKNGSKTIEGRLYKGKFADLRVGGFLQFEESGELLEILALRRYPSFQAMLEYEGLAAVLPGTNDIARGVAIYHQFYTPEQEQKFGVLAIQIKMHR